MTRLVIETARLRLYEFSVERTEDIAFMCTLLNDPAFVRNIGDRKVRSLEEARAYLLKAPIASYAANGFGIYRMEVIANAQTVGVCGLVKRETLQDVDLGYALLPQFYGQGYVREAAAAVLDHAHGVLGLPRVVAITDPLNAASIRVLETLGFHYEKQVQLSADDIELNLFAHQTPR